MSVFVNPFLAGRPPRWISFAIWLATATALLAAAALFCRSQLQDSLRDEANAELAHLDKLHANTMFAFEELRRTATAEPCSAEFLQAMRRVAFRPDGLNEFMYAPNGMVTCSTSIPRAQTPVSLGQPDVDRDEVDVWISKRLDSVGLPGVEGKVLHSEPFAVVVPIPEVGATPSAWLKKELVLSLPDGKFLPLSGDVGTFTVAARANSAGSPLSVLHGLACGSSHDYCVGVRSDASDIAAEWRSEIAVAIALIAFYAVWPASVLHRALRSHWSLEARFLRNLTVESIVCAYQPILDLRTGEISGCEVLARWRDVDGSIVFPDKFIDIVSRSGRTLDFTKMVADRAFEELSSQPPRGTKLQVNFNIFPRDLNSEKLKETFRAFDGERDRFTLALEIVESDALSVDRAEGEIEALARHAVRTYIDDFGNGYSSIHRVASLAIHGVKLDRSFAMAPNESLMARMLVHAVDMIGSSGREIVVEGVETQDRLDVLAATGQVTYVQGYLVSRPLSISRFAEFLKTHEASNFARSQTRAAA